MRNAIVAFLASLLSRKLQFAAAIEVFIALLPAGANTKAMCMAGVAMFYVIAQCIVDAFKEKANAATAQLEAVRIVTERPPPL